MDTPDTNASDRYSLSPRLTLHCAVIKGLFLGKGLPPSSPLPSSVSGVAALLGSLTLLQLLLAAKGTRGRLRYIFKQGKYRLLRVCIAMSPKYRYTVVCPRHTSFLNVQQRCCVHTLCSTYFPQHSRSSFYLYCQGRNVSILVSIPCPDSPFCKRRYTALVSQFKSLNSN